MLNNDISNRKAPSILFRVEDFLVKYRETTTLDKILNKVVGKHKRAELNEDVVHAINNIFRFTDYTVGLVCMSEDWTKFPKDLRDIILLGLPIADLHLVKEYYDIKTMISWGQYTYYVDDNLNNHSYVGDSRCLTLSELTNIIKSERYK